LRKLGFEYVGETAIGAWFVAQETAKYARKIDGPCVATACPAVVNYVERYAKQYLPLLVPVVSPMIAHARHIHESRPKAKVVFIGPCVAKKAEAERNEYAGEVEYAITFEELAEWMKQENITLEGCEESDFDEHPGEAAKLFPLEGGCLRTASLSTDMMSGEVLTVSGFEELKQSLADVSKERRAVLIEPMFCEHGCINGPAMPEGRGLFSRRGDVLAYANEDDIVVARVDHQEQMPKKMATHFSKEDIACDADISEEQIRRVLEQTGKSNPKDQLNCGACGYRTCREKAIAVIRGLAEPEMCIPYMKRLAEQRADRIIDTTPNGIVILDEQLTILHMNPAFRKFFVCSNAVLGRHISYLMDPGPFDAVISGQQDRVESVVKHDKYNIVCHQIFYALRDEKQYVGIFVNITHSRASQEKLEQIRADTLMQAQELHQHQIEMAQKIAAFLGESMGRGEQLVENLMKLANSDDKPNGGNSSKGGLWPWDTRTSK
jgi:uncharacterized Fe-S cluster-containing protein